MNHKKIKINKIIYLILFKTIDQLIFKPEVQFYEYGHSFTFSI